MNPMLRRRALVYSALIAAVLLWELLPSTGARKPGTFEVASWNMQWFPSGYQEPQSPQDEARRISATARIIRKQGVPDIFFVQEIRNTKVCNDLAGQLNDTSFRLVVCSAFIDYETQEPALQQLAIVSRFSAVASGAEPWHASDFVYPPRGYVYAVLNIGGELVGCFNVHLKSNYIPEDLDVRQQTALNTLKRELSSRQLLRHIERLREEGINGTNVTRFIVAGDFNTSLLEKRFASESTIRGLLDAGFKNAFDGMSGDEYATLPANNNYPAATFDYILSAGLDRVGEPYVLPSNWISDHREIRAVFNRIGAVEVTPKHAKSAKEARD